MPDLFISHHTGITGAEYLRVEVPGHPVVLVRPSPTRDAWLSLAPDGTPVLAPTARAAAVRALGFDLPNWRDRCSCVNAHDTHVCPLHGRS